jgi:hypothetical protein
VGHEVTQSLSVSEIPMDCGMCSAQGDLFCALCDGTGNVGSGKNRRRCPTCRGAGRVRCDQCKGSGGVLGKPSVWARMDEHEALRTVGSDALPLDIVFDLSEHPSPGEVIHRQDSTEPIADVRGQAGYRDQVVLTDEIRRALEALLGEPGVPAGVAVHQQTLEVRRTVVLEATLEGGAKLYVWGDPTRVHPRTAATTFLGKLLFFLAT